MTETDLLALGKKYCTSKTMLTRGYGLEKFRAECRPLHKTQPFKPNGDPNWMNDTVARMIETEEEWNNPQTPITKRLKRKCPICGKDLSYAERFSVTCSECKKKVATATNQEQIQAAEITAMPVPKPPTFLTQEQIEKNCSEMTHLSSLADVARYYPGHSVFMPGSVLIRVEQVTINMPQNNK